MNIIKLSGLTLVKNAINVPVQMQLASLSDRLQNNLKWNGLDRTVIYDSILHSKYYSDIFYVYQWHNTLDIYKKVDALCNVPNINARSIAPIPKKLLLLKSNKCDERFHQNDLHNENDGTLPLMTVHVGNNVNLLVKSAWNNVCKNILIESGDTLIYDHKNNNVNNYRFKYDSIKNLSGPKKINDLIGDNILYFTFRA